MYPQIAAVASSIAGYMIEIGLPHPRHRALSRSHDRMGTFSYHDNPRPQPGQCEPGVTMDSFGSAPHRRMQTLRKLPMSTPMRAANPTPSKPGRTRSITRDLVQEDTDSHRDVE